MTTTIANYPNVRKRLEKLGCDIPSGFALLPINLESATSIAEFRQVTEAVSVKKLLRSADIPHSEILPHEHRISYVQNNSWDWIPPLLFVTYDMLSQNPDATRIVVELIRNYLIRLRPDLGVERAVKLEFVVELNEAGVCKRLSYEGPVSGLERLPETIRSVKDEQ